ncbi:MAG: element excision factor XisI family protein [Nostoc sp.]
MKRRSLLFFGEGDRFFVEMEMKGGDRYQVINIGWQELTRIFGCIIYVEIKDGKIWIERDGTEIGVASQKPQS